MIDDTIKMTISVPTDDEGFILLKCEHCGILFKAIASDIQDDGVLHIFCPGCGLMSENYCTDDVIELAIKMAQNKALDVIYDAFKDLKRHGKDSIMSSKTSPKPKHGFEYPIHTGVEALESVIFPCCHKSAKVKPLLKMTGCYCVFCGVKNYEIK